MICLQDYEARKIARAENRRFFDTRMMTYHSERIPEPIRMKIGMLTAQQTAVYEEFARNIPGFLPNVEEENLILNKPIPIQTPVSQPASNPMGADDEAFYVLLERVQPEFEPTIQGLSQVAPNSHMIPMLHSLLEGTIHARSTRDISITQLLARRVSKSISYHLDLKLNIFDYS